jgi:septal ring factor EnvC (AmiA/AmiB activator)
MFFQGLIGFLLLIGGAYAIWKFVIAPGLKGAGIDIEEGEDIITEDTKKLEKMKKQYEDMKASTEAVKEQLDLKKQIKEMEKKIEKAKKKMKKL